MEATLIWIEAHPGLAAWVQAVGSVLAIVASTAVAIWLPISMDRSRRRSYRQGWIRLLAHGQEELESYMFWVRTGGRPNAEGVPGAVAMLEQAIAKFPVHELDDPDVFGEVAELRHSMNSLIDDIRPELHRPRFVFEKLEGYRYAFWRHRVIANARYGWGSRDETPPERDVLDTNPNWSDTFTWDADGNPTRKPR